MQQELSGLAHLCAARTMDSLTFMQQGLHGFTHLCAERLCGLADLCAARTLWTHLPSPKNSVAQSSSLKIAQLVSQCCSRGQIGCNTATVPASVHFIVACVVYYLNDPVSASCEVFLVSSVVASRLATAFLTGN